MCINEKNIESEKENKMGFFNFFGVFKKARKLSDHEWEQLYITDYEGFWEMVLKEGDLSNLPSYREDRLGNPIYGEEAKSCYLNTLKFMFRPSMLNCNKEIATLLKIKHELKENGKSASMLDAIIEYECRYIVY